MRAMDEAVPGGWLVCLGENRWVQDGRVGCPTQDGAVPVEACLLCHHLQTLAGERDTLACDAGGPLRSSPDPQ
jgi:hypothetical protein